MTNTEDIRRVRKKAPCTRPEISTILRQFFEDEIFNEPIFTGKFLVLKIQDLGMIFYFFKEYRFYYCLQKMLDLTSSELIYSFISLSLSLSSFVCMAVRGCVGVLRV